MTDKPSQAIPSNTRDSDVEKVSVIVPCYNIEQDVTQCLQSIVAQTFSNLQVILVDDGSTDQTPATLERFAAGRAGWKVIHQPNAGLSAARNTGIEAATGEWLVFIDGDDILVPKAIEILLHVAKTERLKLVCGNHYVRSAGSDYPVQQPSNKVSILTQREVFESVLYHREIDVSAWGKIYARGLFKTIRFPNGRIYEDTYVFGELLAQVDSIGYLNTPLYHYVVRSGSIVNAKWSGKQMQFIEAVDKFTSHAEKLYPDLAPAALRRRVHARLSVLRYMEHVDGDDRNLRKSVVAYIRRNGTKVLRDPKAPKRDKVGITLASISPRLFFLFWKIYSATRHDR